MMRVDHSRLLSGAYLDNLFDQPVERPGSIRCRAAAAVVMERLPADTTTLLLCGRTVAEGFGLGLGHRQRPTARVEQAVRKRPLLPWIFPGY